MPDWLRFWRRNGRTPTAGRWSRFLACATIAALTAIRAASPALAASENEFTREEKKDVPLMERQVPILSHSPAVVDNGCQVRRNPSEPLEGKYTIPFWELISGAMGRHAVVISISRNNPREDFQKELATLDPDTRTLAALYALWDNLGRDGLHTFFYLKGGNVAFEVRDALESAGLTREHEVFTRAIALFGQDYPVDETRRGAFFGYSKGNGELNTFDDALLAIGKEFPSQRTLSVIIEDFVARSPALWNRIEATRKTLGDRRRLGILLTSLQQKVRYELPDEQAAEAFTPLSPEERTLAAIDLFNSEFENGGVDQFFFNSSGAYAPEVHDALLAVGLKRQAGLFKQGMDLFIAPYPRVRDLRHDSYIGGRNDEGFEIELSDLTDAFYGLDGGPEVTHIGGSTQVQGGPGIRDAMERYAIAHDMLPC